MGCVYTFTCPRCEYRARVSGGREAGFHCVTQTVRCLDCKALHDVAVRARLTEADAKAPSPMTSPSFNSRVTARVTPLLPPMLLFGFPPRTQWVELKPACPVSPRHRVEIWLSPGQCPRCGGYLERDVLPYRIWD